MKLRKRVTLQIGLAVLLVTILGIFSSISITRREFTSFVEQGDYQLAERIAPLIVKYHSQGLSWDEIGISLEPIVNRNNGLNRDMDSKNWTSSQQPGMMGNIGWNDNEGCDSTDYGMMDSDMMVWIKLNDTRIIITDVNRIVRIDSDNILINNEYRNDSQSYGVSLKSGSKDIGTVYVGSMIDSSWSQNQTKFINKLIFGISISALFGFFISAILIWISLYKIIQPISALTHAVENATSGDHTSIVNESGSDELAILSNGFNKMNKSIMNYNEAQNELFSNIAHELKTPLSLIRGNLEAVLDDVYELSKENIESILIETKQLGKIINDMSFLSNISAGVKFEVNEIIKMDVLVSEILGTFKAIAEKEEVSIVNTAQLSDCQVLGDYTKLKQAITNIISNAIKHGGSPGKVKISSLIDSTQAPLRFLKLIILDYGEGVKADELELIFDRLFRTDKSRSRFRGGSGLGLSICKEIVAFHGGNVSAVNHPDAGLEVIVSLPLIKL